MKKLMLLFGLVAFFGTANLSYASTSTDEVVVLDCDKCKDHKCDDTCKKDGCTMKKECGKDQAKCAKGETKACCKKSADGTASAEKKACCKKGSSASCDKKKETAPEDK